MKKHYAKPTMTCLGTVEQLTLTNKLDPLSDVPQGTVGDHGFVDPPGEEHS